MTVEVNSVSRHIVCSWKKARVAKFCGKDVVIQRTIRRRIRLASDGSVHPKELKKLETEERQAALLEEMARMHLAKSNH